MNVGFQRREVVLTCAEVRDYDVAAWHGAIVRVQGGEVEVETIDGTGQRFGVGAVLCPAGLPLRVLHNPGPGAVTLVAIRRNQTDSFSGAVPSYS